MTIVGKGPRLRSDPLQQIFARGERRHPDVKVTISFPARFRYTTGWESGGTDSESLARLSRGGDLEGGKFEVHRVLRLGVETLPVETLKR